LFHNGLLNFLPKGLRFPISPDFSPGKGLGRTVPYTFTAADTLPVQGAAGVHFTKGGAFPAMAAVFSIDLYAVQGITVKKTIDCPQRADKTAERPEDEERKQEKGGQQGQFQEEKAANKLPEGRVEQDQGQGRLQSPGGAEKFTKKWFPVTIDKEGPQGQGRQRKNQEAVFQQGQPPGKGAFGQFGSREPV
jgi:hypothetical protein